ncbi:MAG: InlB B-repeat-containing protein, partial [Actinobacteria bacterium]|nr:InlB B-repeat-containing protein [Actinomycetota bacterium]
MSPMTGSVNSNVTLPKVSFTRPGYAATEWKETKASLSMQCVYSCPEGLRLASWPASSPLWLNRSYVLQPIWEPAWTVTFDGNGGTLGAAAQMPPEVFLFKLPGRLDQNQFTRSGYQFTGWNTKADGTGTAYSQRQVMTPPSDITLYAQWSIKNGYTVSFDANGGTGTQPSPLTSAGGSSVTAPAGSGYTRPGQQFAGWNTAANGT